MENPGLEQPIYIESFQEHRRHWYTATRGDAVHRFPVQLNEIWNDYASIPDTPSALLINDNDVDGVVALRKGRLLQLVPGTTQKYQYQTPPVDDLRQVITATFGQVAPVSGDAGPTLAGSPATGYTPVIQDSAGLIHPMQASNWVVDGINHYVEFPYGVPAVMTPPFRLTYFEYIGPVGGSGGGGGVHVWHYIASPFAPGTILCPDPGFPGPPAAMPSHFVAPLPAQSTEGNNTRLMLDAGKGAVRGGTVTANQWDDPVRGANSVAFGLDTTASGAQSVISGGSNNTATAAHTTVGGGTANNVIAAFGTIGGGEDNNVDADHGTIGGGATNVVTATYGTVAGGENHAVTAGYGTVGGGDGNFVRADLGFVGGGSANEIVAGSTNGTIGGGSGNTITASSIYGFIGGGLNNRVNGGNPHAAVGGGTLNRAQGIAAFVGGGGVTVALAPVESGNRADGDFSFVGGGGGPTNVVDRNEATGEGSVVGGGTRNRATGDFSFIGGGGSRGGGGNQATGNYSVVCGGGGGNNLANNRAFAVASGVHSGFGNQVEGRWARIGGGAKNLITIGGAGEDAAQGSVISGGGDPGDAGSSQQGNTIDRAACAFIGAGRANIINSVATHAAIVGGEGHRIAANAYAAFIGGGGEYVEPAGGPATIDAGNRASANWAVVTGGRANYATGVLSFIGGGGILTSAAPADPGNEAAGDYSVVAGGGGPLTADRNIANDDWGVITGGRANSIATPSPYGFIGGGSSNSVTAETHGNIVGGTGNNAGGDYSFIGAGNGNTITGDLSVVGGGQTNSATGDWAVVGGGNGNAAAGQYSFVGSGIGNTADDQYSVVCGGSGNTADGQGAAVAGGQNNTAQAQRAFVAGGLGNSVFADLGWAGGNGSTVNHLRSFVWSDTVGRASTVNDEVTFGATGGFRILDGCLYLLRPNATGGGIVFDEVAANPCPPAAGQGTFWVRSDAPNVPMFTDDVGTDHNLLDAAGAAVTLASAGTLPGNLSLVNDGTGPTLATAALVAGAGITLTPTPGAPPYTDITIAAPGAALTTLADAGTLPGHFSLVNDGTGPTLANVGLSVSGALTITPTPGLPPHTDLTLGTGAFGGVVNAPWNIIDQKGFGIHAGTYPVALVWQTRDLNTISGNPGTDVQLNVAPAGVNQMLIQPGTYYMFATAPAVGLENHRIRLQNITDGVPLLYGTSEHTRPTGQLSQVTGNRSVVDNTFTIVGAQKVCEIQHYGTALGPTPTPQPTALGVATNFAGASEIYTVVTIFKLA